MMAPQGTSSVGSQAILALLPFGGVMATLVEMYADESYGGDDTAGPLCVALYLYEREQAVTATEKWVNVLNDSDLPQPLPFFRMSDCAHGVGVFKDMKDHCDRIARKMITIPRAHSIIGFAATVDQGDYAEIIPRSEGYPNPYTFLIHMCLGFIKQWIRDNSYTGAVIYNFEAGHKHHNDANRIMSEISNTDRMKRSHSYAGHSFVEKRIVPIVQSADLLAWHSFTDFKRRARGEGMRKDLVALGRPQDKSQHWTAEHLRQAAPYIMDYNLLTEQIESMAAR